MAELMRIRLSKLIRTDEQMLHLLKSDSSLDRHEQVFVQRYEHMLGWAMHLTDQDQAQAEDLLHDAFIQFVVCRPDLGGIQNLDGYLYSILRFLRLSQLKRASRSHIQQLSAIDYDSAEKGLNVIDPRERLRVQDDLRAICYYACIRKESSKAGSVLILRFFLGYYPSEIARVFGSTRKVVDMRLQAARREARLFLDAPERLSLLHGALPARPLGKKDTTMTAQTNNELMHELRAEVFQSRRGECLSREQFEQMYNADGAAAVDNPHLSHIVSCPDCLDQVNDILGLPPLAERYPTDMSGPDSPSSRGNGRGGRRNGGKGNPPGGGMGMMMRRMERLAQEVFEHRPQELHIAVNGLILGSQRIHAELSEQTLELIWSGQPEPINFIEVFSEQQTRMLLFPVGDPPPVGPTEQTTRVELSDGRTLELKLCFRCPHPTLEAVYHDPLMAAETAAHPELEEDTHFEFPLNGKFVVPALAGSIRNQSSPAKASATSFSSEPETAEALSEIAPQQSALGAMAAWLRSLPRRRNARREQPSNYPTLPYAPPKLFEVTPRFRLGWPGTIAAFATFILLSIALLMRLNTPVTPAVTAAELLQKSIAAEARLTEPTQVLHRTMSLEERDPAGGRVLARHRVEVWQGTGRGAFAKRLYDERDHLIAGEWAQADGLRKLYRRVDPSQNGKSPNRGKEMQAAENLIWRQELSCRSFSALIGQTATATLEDRSDMYILSYELPPDGAPVADGAVLKANLTLNKADLRAIAQTLLVRTKQTAPQLREYRFIESGFQRLQASEVPATVFQPDAELLGTASRVTEVEAPTPANPTTPASPARMTAAELAALEVEAHYLLDQAGSASGEQVAITRTAEGGLQVRALVDTDKRKDELLAALKPLRERPNVTIDIATYAEAARRQPRAPSGPVIISEAQVPQQQMPAGPDLRRHFSAQAEAQPQLTGGPAPEAWVEEQVARFATRMQSQAVRPVRHAWALKNLIARIPPEEAQGLDAASRAKWQGMIRSHALGVRRETESLRRVLQPIFFSAAQSESEPDAPDKIDLKQLVEQLIALTSAHDKAVSKAFSSSAGGVEMSLKTAQFQQSLRSVERLAAALEKYD
jgi:RNA polymerase sigma factor (sigma-70 family)